MISLRTTSLLTLPALLAAFALGLTAPQATAGTPAELKRLQRIYASELHKIDSKYATRKGSFGPAYLKRLDELRATLQSVEGDLDGVEATQKEKRRFTAACKAKPDPFEPTPGMPGSAVVESPASLRQLQLTYMQWYAKASDERKEQTDKLNVTYLAKLEELQRELTRGDRIPDAREVKSEAERVRNGVFTSPGVSDTNATVP